MPPIIDLLSYRKDTRRPLGQGYGMRPSGVAPSSIVIHTTNNARRGTSFASEAIYLRDSPNVGAAYLNGKSGQIAQILSPDLAAWQAGESISAFSNAHSIGIENHVSIGDAWTTAQHDSLTWLVRMLMARYHIGVTMIETHRRIALPIGRKSDPGGWPDAAFYAWRALLVLPVPAVARAYRVRSGLAVYQRADHTGALWGFLAVGDQIAIDDTSNGHLADSRGFVDMAGLELVA